MTGRTSISLRQEAYRKALEAEGISLVGTNCDEGGNHYSCAEDISFGAPDKLPHISVFVG